MESSTTTIEKLLLIMLMSNNYKNLHVNVHVDKMQIWNKTKKCVMYKCTVHAVGYN